jgi:hypothetical protein
VLRQSTRGLADLLRGRIASEPPNAFSLLLVVDQFEEIFASLAPIPQATRSFLSSR